MFIFLKSVKPPRPWPTKARKVDIVLKIKKIRIFVSLRRINYLTKACFPVMRFFHVHLRTYAHYASMNEFTCSEHSVRIL